MVDTKIVTPRDQFDVRYSLIPAGDNWVATAINGRERESDREPGQSIQSCAHSNVGRRVARTDAAQIRQPRQRGIGLEDVGGDEVAPIVWTLGLGGHWFMIASFEFGRAQITESRVPPLAIVKALYSKTSLRA
jgi:hypothetical protein